MGTCFQDRASSAEPKGWDSEGCGNSVLCGWGIGDYPIQGLVSFVMLCDVRGSSSVSD